MSIEVNEACGLWRGQDDRLRAHPAAGFQHPAAGRVAGIGVQQPGQRGGLVVQPDFLAGRVPVDVVDPHAHLPGAILRARARGPGRVRTPPGLAQIPHAAATASAAASRLPTAGMPARSKSVT